MVGISTKMGDWPDSGRLQSMENQVCQKKKQPRITRAPKLVLHWYQIRDRDGCHQKK